MSKKTYIQREFGRKLRRVDGNTDYDTVLFKDSIPVSSGLDDQFSLTIENTGETAQAVAIIPGHYDTSSFVLDAGAGTVTKSMSNPDELNKAGYSIDAVVDDGTYTTEKGKLKFVATDPTKSIRSLLDFIRTNPRALKGLRLMANDKSAFNTIVSVSASSPFSRPAMKDIHLNNFFRASQYQPDIIEIDFTKKELEIADITLMIANIQPNSWIEFTLKF